MRRTSGGPTHRRRLTGQTGADITNKKDIGTKGLTEKAGIFSYGGWKFTLYGYADSARTELAYKGSADVVINAKTTTLSVTVQSQTAGNGSGYLQIPAKGAITLKLNDSDTNPTSVEDYTKLTEKVYIEGSEEGNKAFSRTEYITNTEKPTDIELASGSYKVTITYQSKEDPAEDDEDKTAPVIYAEDVIYVTIADYLITKIGGDISENNGQVEFIAQGEIIKAKVEKTVEEGKPTVLEVKAAPVSAAADTTPKTTVSIPSGVLETGKSASLSVTSFSTTAIDDGDAEDAEFTVVDTSDKGKPILGALDITLTVGTEEKKDFKDKPLTITTVISKGLNGNKNYPTEGDNTACSIQVKYNGEGDGGTVTSYKAETGELTFKVTHLSTYYVVDDNIKVYNLTQDLMYGKLEDAVAAAEDGDTIRLLNDVVMDLSASENGLEISKSIVIDLNKNTVTLKSVSLNIGDNVIFKNGTLSSEGEGNIFYVNEGTLVLEKVIITGKISFYGIVIENNDSVVKVSSGITLPEKTGETLYFGKIPLTATDHAGDDISWKVLAVDSENSRALILSDRILTKKQTYDNATYADWWEYKYKWSECDINKWLNGDFLSEYGLEDVPMASVEHETEGTSTQASEKTSEKVFLLSESEVNKYLTTKIAYCLDDTKWNKTGSAYYWSLRTPTISDYGNIKAVSNEGKIEDAQVSNSYGIRPAFWINCATTTVLGTDV